MNRLKVHIPKGTRSAGLRLTSRVGAIAGPAGTSRSLLRWQE
jgi:hypothetical protein